MLGLWYAHDLVAQSITGGGVILIIFFVGLFVYFVGGMLYNYLYVFDLDCDDVG